MASICVVFRDCSENKNVRRFPVTVSQGNGNTDLLYSAIAKQTGSSEDEFGNVVHLSF
jgi:hypothetical protein